MSNPPAHDSEANDVPPELKPELKPDQETRHSQTRHSCAGQCRGKFASHRWFSLCFSPPIIVNLKKGFSLVGPGSCQDSDAGLYDSIQLSATSTLSCQDLCVEFDGIVGYHFYASVGRCYCNLDNGSLTGNTGFGNCPPRAQCLSDNDGSGPVESASGNDRIVCYKNNNFV